MPNFCVIHEDGLRYLVSADSKNDVREGRKNIPEDLYGSDVKAIVEITPDIAAGHAMMCAHVRAGNLKREF